MMITCFYLSKLFQIIDEFQSPYIFVCGDFNSNIRSPSQFDDDLLQLFSDNSLCLADALFLPRNTFTFISSSHDTVSWLDHILTTTSGYSLFTDVCVKSDFITPDHLPLCFTISVDNLYVPISFSANNIPCDALRYNWYGASDLDISNYYSCTKAELSRIKLNYTMITLLQVGMTMLAIITIYLALISNGGWLITDHAMGQFIMQ